MDSRKVIKIEDSYYINIPSEVSKALEIVKGDRMRIANWRNKDPLIVFPLDPG